MGEQVAAGIENNSRKGFYDKAGFYQWLGNKVICFLMTDKLQSSVRKDTICTLKTEYWKSKSIKTFVKTQDNKTSEDISERQGNLFGRCVNQEILNENSGADQVASR